MKRPHLLPMLAVAALAVCTTGPRLAPARASEATYNISMNWFPEPEHGGFYYAEHMGLWKKYGINTTVREFSFAIGNTITQLLLPGKASFVMANADEVLQQRAKGAKIVAIMDTFQTNPQGFVYHAEDTRIHSVADFSNHDVIFSFGAGYWPYLLQKYHYANIKTRSYDFTSRAFALDPKAVNQCYVTSEPYRWGQQGIKLKYVLIADSGYNPYSEVIVTTEDLVKNHPDQVKAFVKGAIEGWTSYLKDPMATNTYMRAAPGAKNSPLKPDEQGFSYSQIKKLGLVAGGDARTHGIGYQSEARWKTLQQQMVGVGQKVGSVDVTQAYTNQFVPAMGAM